MLVKLNIIENVFFACKSKWEHLLTFFSDPQGFKDTKLPNGGINIFATLLHTHLAGN